MEAPVTLGVLSLIAAWAWVCLAWVANRGLPTAIRLQQELAAYTPRKLYHVARRGRWLAAGAAAVGAAGLLAGWGLAMAVGLLAVAAALLTYLLAGRSKLLQPRVVAAILSRPTPNGPADPHPAA